MVTTRIHCHSQCRNKIRYKRNGPGIKLKNTKNRELGPWNLTALRVSKKIKMQLEIRGSEWNKN